MIRLAKAPCSTTTRGLRPWLDLGGLGGRFDGVYETGLLETVRTGRASYVSVHGRPLWEDVHALGRAAEFDRMMGSDAAEWVRTVARSRDWSATARVADVGGGDGTLLAELVRVHPARHPDRHAGHGRGRAGPADRPG